MSNSVSSTHNKYCKYCDMNSRRNKFLAPTGVTIHNMYMYIDIIIYNDKNCQKTIKWPLANISKNNCHLVCLKSQVKVFSREDDDSNDNTEAMMIKYDTCTEVNKLVAAFRGMHVSPAKHSFGKCDRRTDRQTDVQTDDGQSDPYVSLCFAGDTKNWTSDLIMSVYTRRPGIPTVRYK